MGSITSRCFPSAPPNYTNITFESENENENEMEFEENRWSGLCLTWGNRIPDISKRKEWKEELLRLAMESDKLLRLLMERHKRCVEDEKLVLIGLIETKYPEYVKSARGVLGRGEWRHVCIAEAVEVNDLYLKVQISTHLDIYKREVAPLIKSKIEQATELLTDINQELVKQKAATEWVKDFFLKELSEDARVKINLYISDLKSLYSHIDSKSE